jgi:hypothetical protein
MNRGLITSTRGRLSILSLAAILVALAFSAIASAASVAQVSHSGRHPHATQAAKRTAKRSPNAKVTDAAKRAAAKRAAAKAAAAKAKGGKKAPVHKTPTKTSPTATPAASISYGSVTTAAATPAPAPAVTTVAPSTATPAVSTAPTSSASTTPTSGSVAAPSNGSILWGSTIGTQFEGGQQAPWDMNVVSDFENQDAGGKGESIIPFYDDFLNCPNDQAGQVDSSCTDENFPLTPFNNIRAHGSIPMLSWGSQTLQDGYANTASDSNFTLAKVASGAYDSYITAWAQKAAAWGHPFFLRFDWEMNGNWFPWSVGSNGNTAADFVAAWRHVHDIFVKNGATNATWVWCPNAGYASQLAALYPGDAYVDWTCMDAYNYGTDEGNSWQSFDQVASSDYDAITGSIAPSKPMMIGEFNSSSAGGDQAAWLKTTLAEIPVNYPKIRAVVAFDASAGGADFTLEGNAASQSAFAAGIANPAYASNTFGNLGGGAVTPQ